MRKLLSFSLILASLGLLTSCAPGKAKSEKAREKVELKYPMEYVSDKNAIEGGTFSIGLVTASPFKGIFDPLFASDSTDSGLVALMNDEIFWQNEDFERMGIEGGMATYTFDTDKNEIIIKFKDGLKWSDGHALGVDDLIYTAEVLGHPDYTGVTYDPSEHGKIIGMKEYHEGKAKTISGLEKVSDTELRIHMESLSPKLISGGGALIGLSRIIPKHYLSDIPVKNLTTSDKVRKKPLSNGKYVLSKLVPGESMELVPNEYYYLGKAKVDKVFLKTLTSQVALESLKNGEYFTYWGLPSDIYEKYKDFNNVALIGGYDLSYNYLMFNLGHFDEKTEKNVQDRKTPLQDVRIRQAMAYAMNLDEIATAYFKGLRTRANGVTLPVFNKYYNKDLVGYPYNPEKAKELLKEAGYVDTNGDGIVDKDGKNLEIKLAMAGGSDISEPFAQALLQYWKEIGVKVDFTTGRLLDINVLYDKIQANSDDVDMFIGGWSVGTSLDPAQSTSRTARFNFPRFVDDENDKLLEALNDKKGLADANYRAEAYKVWEKHYIEDIAVEIPMFFKYGVEPVNKNIKQANQYHDSARSRIFEQLVDKTPLKATN